MQSVTSKNGDSAFVPFLIMSNYSLNSIYSATIRNVSMILGRFI